MNNTQLEGQKNFFFIQNIIAPYRTALFNGLVGFNFPFEVGYMGKTENDRSWDIDLSDLKFKYKIYSGWYKFVKGYHVHFNFSMIYDLIKRKDITDIILSVSWNDLNILVLVFLKKTGIIKKKIHFWTEANYLTIGASRQNRLKVMLRSFSYSAVDGAFIIPGKMAKRTLELWKVDYQKLIYLPNLIDEEIFTLSVDYLKLRAVEELPIFILPVRLIEKIKGVINFFEAIGRENIYKGVFLVAGDGPDYEHYKDYISLNDFSKHIFLLGFCDKYKMKDLYQKANVMILPSFSDQSPLALVEAIKMKLPILASGRCGNHFETVVDGYNGLIFDPYVPSTIKTTFEEILDKRNKWHEWGENSIRLFEKNFKMDLCLKYFVQNMYPQ